MYDLRWRAQYARDNCWKIYKYIIIDSDANGTPLNDIKGTCWLLYRSIEWFSADTLFTNSMKSLHLKFSQLQCVLGGLHMGWNQFTESQPALNNRLNIWWRTCQTEMCTRINAEPANAFEEQTERKSIRWLRGSGIHWPLCIQQCHWMNVWHENQARSTQVVSNFIGSLKHVLNETETETLHWNPMRNEAKYIKKNKQTIAVSRANEKQIRVVF